MVITPAAIILPNFQHESLAGYDAFSTDRDKLVLFKSAVAGKG
jgi:hypothetical protein